MSSTNVSVFMLQRLREWGVRRIYGYPGDGTNGLNLAFHEVGDEVEFVQLRHEELAAFAACAHAKLTGEVGVCMATSGPGAIHLLNGLYDAKLDNAPVVAIVGQQKRMSLGGDFQQEVDLRSLYKDVASEYLAEVSDPRQATHVVDRAVRIARAERTVTAIIVPSDVQEMAYEAQGPRHPLNERSSGDVVREVLAGERGAVRDEVGGRALEDDPAAVLACAGPEVDDPIGVCHDRLVVLDDDDRLAGVDEPVEQAEQLRDVCEVQAGCRLVEDVDAALLDHVGRQLETLPLAA